MHNTLTSDIVKSMIVSFRAVYPRGSDYNSTNVQDDTAVAQKDAPNASSIESEAHGGPKTLKPCPHEMSMSSGCRESTDIPVTAAVLPFAYEAENGSSTGFMGRHRLAGE